MINQCFEAHDLAIRAQWEAQNVAWKQRMIETRQYVDEKMSLLNQSLFMQIRAYVQLIFDMLIQQQQPQ